MIFLFDTSAINHLIDDPDSEALLTGILATSTVWVSALNVIEVCRTTDTVRRQSLLCTLKRLTRRNRPIEAPPLLLQRLIRAYTNQLPSIDYSVGTENDAIWQILNEPSLVSGQIRLELFKWQKDLEKGFIDIHRERRPILDAAFNQGITRPPGVSEFLRAYANNYDLLHTTIGPIYARLTGKELPVEEIPPLLNTLPELLCFHLAWAHSIYKRSVSPEDYGRQNAGNVDLWFATYLPRIQRFITADERQYEAFCSISQVASPKCQVLQYSSLQKRLLIS